MHYPVLVLELILDFSKMKGIVKTQETVLQCEKGKSTFCFEGYIFKAYLCQSLAL